MLVTKATAGKVLMCLTGTPALPAGFWRGEATGPAAGLWRLETPGWKGGGRRGCHRRRHRRRRGPAARPGRVPVARRRLQHPGQRPAARCPWPRCPPAPAPRCPAAPLPRYPLSRRPPAPVPRCPPAPPTRYPAVPPSCCPAAPVSRCPSVPLPRPRRHRLVLPPSTAGRVPQNFCPPPGAAAAVPPYVHTYTHTHIHTRGTENGRGTHRTRLAAAPPSLPGAGAGAGAAAGLPTERSGGLETVTGKAMLRGEPPSWLCVHTCTQAQPPEVGSPGQPRRPSPECLSPPAPPAAPRPRPAVCPEGYPRNVPVRTRQRLPARSEQALAALRPPRAGALAAGRGLWAGRWCPLSSAPLYRKEKNRSSRAHPLSHTEGSVIFSPSLISSAIVL